MHGPDVESFVYCLPRIVGNNPTTSATPRSLNDRCNVLAHALIAIRDNSQKEG